MEECRRIAEDCVRREYKRRYPFPPSSIEKFEIATMHMQGVADKRVCHIHGHIKRSTILNPTIEFYVQVNTYTASCTRVEFHT